MWSTSPPAPTRGRESTSKTSRERVDTGVGRPTGGQLANLLFTLELARRLEGTGVTANAVHPGLVATSLLTNNGLAGRLMNLGLRVAGKSVAAGTETIAYLATSPDVAGVTGEYFAEKKAVPSSQAARDTAAAGRLWRISAELTGLEVQS